jgi:hypothetical protein
MLLEHANQIPPFICRFIARKREQQGDRRPLVPLSHRDIAQRAGLPRQSVADLSRRLSWEGVPLDVADRFAAACGVNLMKPGNHLRALREGRLGHLKEGNAQQRRFFARLMEVQGVKG